MKKTPKQQYARSIPGLMAAIPIAAPQMKEIDMNFDRYKKVFSQGSIGRYDITPLFADADLFASLVDDLVRPFEGQMIDKIVGIDALGFILGTAVALRLERGLVLCRKQGKIPLPVSQLVRRSFVDYTHQTKGLEMDRMLLKPGERVLIVDDWVESGSQIRAVISMLEELQAITIGISCIGADHNDQTRELFQKYHLHAIGVDA